MAGTGVAGAHAVLPIARAATAYNNGYQNELACAAANECIAVASNGTQHTFNPTRSAKVRRSRPLKAIDVNSEQLGLTCVTKGLCVMADAAGKVAAFDPVKPGKPAKTFSVTGQYSQTAVSCPSKSRCVAETYQGEAVFNPQHPGSPKSTAFTANGDSSQPTVSCPSTKQCDGNGGDGDTVYNYNPLHAAAAVVHTFKPVPQIGMTDCRSTTSCVTLSAAKDGALGEATNLGVFTYNPRHPKKPKVTRLTSATLEILTCASATLCAAGGNNGGVFVFNPKAPKRHLHFVAFPYDTDMVGAAFIGSAKLVLLSYQGKKAVLNPKHPPKSIAWVPMGKATKVKAGKR